jgi:MFS family permease
VKVLPENTRATGPTRSATAVRLGLKANWPQFALLVLVNAFVGGMVGLERTLLPLLAEREFGVASASAALSFIIAFGLVKALTNFFAGRFSDKLGRKPLLVAGWLVGLPVPVLLIVAPGWEWVIIANVLLGINQGLCWSTTVIMKIDLVGPARRGLAMGLNEAAGYGAVALSTLAAGYLAGAYGLRPYPFLMGLGFAGLGLVISVFFVRETHAHARLEALTHTSTQTSSGQPRQGQGKELLPDNLSALEVFKLASWQDRRLFAVSQAGLVNNLNDGLVWGLMPLYLARFGLSLETIAGIGATYLASWGALQLFTGALSDRVGRRPFITGGMLLQGLAIGLLLAGNASAPGWWYGAAFLLGLGTALVYPTLLATIGDIAHPRWRASAVGVYRLWRDSGYAFGAILAGVIADLVSMEAAIGVIAGLTALSGVIASSFLKLHKQSE